MNTELQMLLNRMRERNVKTIEDVLSVMDEYVTNEVVWSVLSDEWNRMTLKMKRKFARKVINK